MNQSNFKEYISAAAFDIINLMCVLPFAVYQAMGGIGTQNYTMVVLAGVFGSTGLFFFGSTMSSIPKELIGLILLITTLAQSLVPVVHHLYQNGLEATTTRQGAGFIVAIVAVWLPS